MFENFKRVTQQWAEEEVTTSFAFTIHTATETLGPMNWFSAEAVASARWFGDNTTYIVGDKGEKYTYHEGELYSWKVAE